MNLKHIFTKKYLYYYYYISIEHFRLGFGPYHTCKHNKKNQTKTLSIGVDLQQRKPKKAMQHTTY